jgi:cation:H+ antiporter
LLYLGAEWFVAGASELALAIRIPQIVVGLTVVAHGTSAPKVIVGIQAARRGCSDPVLGNVIGSNIFNVLICLGSAALVGKVGAPIGSIGIDLVTLISMTALLVLFTRRPRNNSRLEGGVALLAYAILMVITVVRG